MNSSTAGCLSLTVAFMVALAACGGSPQSTPAQTAAAPAQAEPKAGQGAAQTPLTGTAPAPGSERFDRAERHLVASASSPR